MKTFYSSSVEQVVQELNSDKYRGLSYKNLSENIDKFGENIIKVEMDRSVLKTVFNLKEYILFFIALLVSIGLKFYICTIAVLIMMIAKLTLSILDYKNKKKKTQHIESLNYTDVNIVRAGTRDCVRADILTVGDIVFLKKGDIISADIRIIEEENLYVNERNITSIDTQVRKYSTRIDRVKSLDEISNMVFRGTRVVRGSAKGIVVSIGNDTQIGRLLEYIKISDVRSRKVFDTLEESSRNTSIFMFVGATIISMLLIFVQSNITNEYIALVWFIACSINTKSVDKIYFLLKKKILFKEGIFIDDFNILKRFSDINVLFMPKISSVSNSKMNIKTIYTSNALFEDINKIDKSNINIERILNIGILNNNATFQSDKNTYMGNLIDAAILEFCNKNAIFKSVVLSKYKPIFNISDDKGISTSVNKVRANYRASVKGYVDEVLERCKYIMIDGVERDITDDDIEKIRMIDFNISNKGYETVGFAYRSFAYEPSEDENIESNLVFVGISGFENELREDAKKLVFELKKNHVLPILITDDNKIVATRIGIDLGIARGMEEVVSGVELLSLDKDEFINVLSRVRVLCRITPAIKSKIINLFSNEGYNVVAVGENLSDIPSISTSDIGIVSGKRPAKLLEKMADIKIGDNILFEFLKMLKQGDNAKLSKDKLLTVYKVVFLYELFIVLYASLIMRVQAFDFVALAILNILILPFLSLLIFYDDIEFKSNIKKLIISIAFKIILFTVSVNILIVDMKFEFISFVCIYYVVMLSIFIRNLNLKDKFRKYILIGNSIIFVLIILIYAYIIGVLGLVLISKIFIILIIYTIFELLLKKWQG